MELSPETAAGGGVVAVLVGVFGRAIGAAIMDAVRQQKSSPSLRPPNKTDERVEELHSLLAQRDPTTDGYLLVREAQRCSQLLERIADSVAPEAPPPRARMGSQSGAE